MNSVKFTRIIAILCILTLLFSSNFWTIPITSAGNNPSVSKIGSSLSLRVKIKTRHLAQSAQSRNLARNAVATPDSELKIIGNMADINREKIFIRFARRPTSAQLNELQSLGVTAYPDSWIPPVSKQKTGFIVADMPVDKLDTLAAKDYIVKLDTAEKTFKPQNDVARTAMGVGTVWTGGNNGAGVTVAVLDSGIDTANPDFPTLNSTNSKDYSDYPDSTDDTITNTVTGHGTHVAGSVLGRGFNSTSYKGVAPDANLVFLKIGKDTDGSASSAAIIKAIQEAVDTYQADIITMSYGGWSDYHDGSDEICQAVDDAVSQGTTVFISAGNDGAAGQHYSGTVNGSSETNFIRVNVTGAGSMNTALAFNLVWFDGIGTHNDLELEYYDSTQLEIPADHIITGAQSESLRGTENESSYFDTPLPSGNGVYYLKVENTSPNNQGFHIYDNFGSPAVTFASPDPDYTLSSPAEADGAIAVGAYVSRTSWTDYQGATWTYGATTLDSIATFSSRGPRVDSSAPGKPEIVAPGQGIISVRDTTVYPWPSYNTSADIYPYFRRIIDNDGLNRDGTGPADYLVLQGTSMACPVAAGVGALLLSKNPTLTPAQVKQALTNTADNRGDPGFDNIYGWGLVNASEAVSSVSSVKISFTTSPQMITAGAASAVITIETRDESDNQVSVLAATPVNLTSTSISGVFSLSNTSWANITAVTIPAGSNSASFYYKDTIVGTPTISAASTGYTSGTQVETIVPRLLVSGFTTPASAGTAYDFTVTAQDGSGGTITSYAGIVHFTSSDSQAVLPADYTFTGAGAGKDNGTHTFSATLKTTGSQSITATDTVTATITGTQSGITVNAAAASQIRVETAANGSGSVVPNQNLIAGNSLTVYGITRDQYNNFIGNPANTTWSLTPKTGGVADSDLNAASGVSVTMTGHLAGSAIIHAANGALTPGDSGTIFVTLLPPSIMSIFTAPVIGASVDVNLATQPVILVTDSGANPVGGITVTASRGTGTGTLRGTLTAATDAAGKATFTNLGYNKSGEAFTIHFAAASLSADSASLGPIATGATSAISIFTAPVIGASVDVNLATQPVILVVDQYGNPKNGTVVTALRGTGTGTLIGTLTATTDAAGKATFTNLGYNKSGEAFTIRFTAPVIGGGGGGGGGGSGGGNDVFVFSAALGPIPTGVVTQIRVETAANGSGTVVPAQNVTAGSPLTVYAITRDQYANFIANAAGTWSLSIKTVGVADGDLLPAVDNPSAVFTGHLLGTAVIRVTSGALVYTDSGILTVVPKFSVTGYPASIAGTVNSFTVTVQDGSGGTITGYTGVVHFTSSDSQAVLPADYTFTGAGAGDNGTHTFSATLKTTGSQSLTATDTVTTGITGTQSGITVNPAVKNKLIWGTQPPAAVTAGATWTAFTVKIADQYGNQTADTDSVTIVPASGVLGGTLIKPAVAGLATFNDITRNLSGTLTLTATSEALVAAPASITITVNAGAASQIRVESAANGSGGVVADQNLTIGTSLTVYAVARDQFGNFVANIAATWSFTSTASGVANTDLVAAVDNKSAAMTGHLTGTGIIHAASGVLVSTDSGTITVISGVSSGGGGGSSSGKVLSPGLTSGTTVYIGSDGVMPSNAQLKTTDGLLTLDIAKGTKMLTAEKNAVAILSAEPLTSPPAPPPGAALLVAYTFGPAGATFDPGITITMPYDPAKLPKDVAEKDLYIAYYNGTTWEMVKSTVDTTTRTVSAVITHFSDFALMGNIVAPPTPTPSPSPTPVPVPEEKPVPGPLAELTPAAVSQPAISAPSLPAPTLAEITTPPTEQPASNSYYPLLIGIVVIVIAGVATFIVMKRRNNLKGIKPR